MTLAAQLCSPSPATSILCRWAPQENSSERRVVKQPLFSQDLIDFAVSGEWALRVNQRPSDDELPFLKLRHKCPQVNGDGYSCSREGSDDPSTNFDVAIYERRRSHCITPFLPATAR